MGEMIIKSETIEKIVNSVKQTSSFIPQGTRFSSLPDIIQTLPGVYNNEMHYGAKYTETIPGRPATPDITQTEYGTAELLLNNFNKDDDGNYIITGYTQLDENYGIYVSAYCSHDDYEWSTSNILCKIEATYNWLDQAFYEQSDHLVTMGYGYPLGVFQAGSNNNFIITEFSGYDVTSYWQSGSMSVSYTITVYNAATVQTFEKEVVVTPGDPGTPDTYKHYLRFPTCFEEIKELYRDGEKVEVLGKSYIGYEVSKEEPSDWYSINPIDKSYQPCHIMCPIESSGGRGSYLNKRIMIPSSGIHAEPLIYHTVVDYYEGVNYVPNSTPPLELTIYPYDGANNLTIHVKYCASEEEGEYDYDINLTYCSMEELVNNYVEVEYSGDGYYSLNNSFALY